MLFYGPQLGAKSTHTAARRLGADPRSAPHGLVTRDKLENLTASQFPHLRNVPKTTSWGVL